MKQLLNQMRMQARMASSDTALPKIGIVTSYDPDHFSVKVRLQPEDTIETGWLPLLSPWVGNGWGMFCAPSVGDMIEVQFEQGYAEAAFACMRFFSNQARPLPAPSGEFWLVHQSGSFVKLLNDGSIVSNAPAWNHTGDHNVDGSISTTGNISAGTGATGTFTTADGQTVLVQDGIVISIG